MIYNTTCVFLCKVKSYWFFVYTFHFPVLPHICYMTKLSCTNFVKGRAGWWWLQTLCVSVCVCVILLIIYMGTSDERLKIMKKKVLGMEAWLDWEVYIHMPVARKDRFLNVLKKRDGLWFGLCLYNSAREKGKFLVCIILHMKRASF